MKDDFKITKALIDLSTESIFIIRNGIIQYANSNLIKISGYHLSELIGFKFTEFVNPKEIEKINVISVNREKGENPPLQYLSSAKLKNGKFIDVEVSISEINFEGKPSFQVVLRDITKGRIAENKYQNLIDFAPIGFYQTLRNGDFILANEEMARILGFEDNKDLISRNIADFYFSAGEREKLIKKFDTRENSEVKNLEVKFQKKEGSTIWVLMTSRAIKDKCGDTIYYDGFIIDISNRKKYEEQLKNRIHMEEVFNEISFQFVKGSYLESDKLIDSALKKLGLFTNVDRVYVFQFENNTSIMSNTHEWCNNGIESQINKLQQLPVDSFPWWMKKMKSFEIINFDNITSLPDEASAERKILEEQGIISILVLPMLSEGLLIGYVGFDTVSEQKIWADYDIRMLKTMSDLISGEISRTNRMYELKKVMDAEEEAKKRYKSLFYDNCSVMLLIDPSTGDIVDANKSACKYYRYSYQKLISSNISQINTLSESEIENEMQNALNEKRQHFIFKHRLSNGELRDVEVYSGKLNVSGNDLLYSIVHDVTKRKTAEEKVLKLSTSLEQSPINIVITDYNGTIEYANSCFLKTTGYKKNELIGNNPKILKSGIQTKEFYTELWETILAGKKWQGEICNKKKNGDLYWENAIISPIKNKAGEIKHFVGIKEDITNKREIERKLNFLADSLEHVGECVSITDEKDNIFYVNKAFCTTYGYSKDELLGQNISILQPDDDIQVEKHKKILNETKKGDWKGEMINKRKDNSLFPIMLSTSVVKDDSKKTLAYIGVAIDITEIKKNMNELITAKEKAEESDRLKSSFLANMSHEIRTPMNGILGFTKLLLRQNISEYKKEEYIKIIHRSGERMLNTVNDIIEISKIQAGIVLVKKTEINVLEVIENILSFFLVQAQKKGILLSHHNHYPEVNLFCFTDKSKFESILTNLIKNAIKFTNKGKITLNYRIINGFIEFCVKDTGIGIPKNQQSAIFNRFVQADIEDTKNYEGSGLGLAIANSYTKMLGGEIWVKSEKDIGSEFYFTIPFITGTNEENQRLFNVNA